MRPVVFLVGNALLLSLAACGGGGSKPEEGPTAAQNAVEPPPPLYQPENPFDEPGTYGVGRGWKALGSAYAPKYLKIEDAALRLDAPSEERHRPIACQEASTPVESTLLVRAKVRTEDIESDKKWGGLRLLLRFYDENDEFIRNQQSVSFVNFLGSRDWQDVSYRVRPPDGAATYRLCAELIETEGGRGWVKDYAVVHPREEFVDAPNILWVVVDTLRGDMIGRRVGDHSLTPNLDRLAQEGLYFEKAWTQYTWTLPAFTSYMTSTFARTHGWTKSLHDAVENARRLDPALETMDDALAIFSRWHIAPRLDAGLVTFAEVLRDAGYETVGYTANGMIGKSFSFDRGFYSWRVRPEQELVGLAREEFSHWAGERHPHFLYLHFMATHSPLCPSEDAERAAGVKVDKSFYIGPYLNCPKGGIQRYAEYPKDQKPDRQAHLAAYRDAYLASVWEADRRLGNLLRALETEGLADNTYVVITADHGEMLGEHGVLGHSGDAKVYEPVTWVPLFLVGRDLDGASKPPVAQLIDVAPTLLELAGLRRWTPQQWQGRSLLHPHPADEPAVVERDGRVAYTLDGDLKLVGWTFKDEPEALFSLKQDPGEEHSLLEQPPEGYEPLQQAAREWRVNTPEYQGEGGEAVTLDDQTIEQLRELGYVEDEPEQAEAGGAGD